jgi:hypothetical protein
LTQCLELSALPELEKELLELTFRKFQPFIKLLFLRYQSSKQTAENVGNLLFGKLEETSKRVGAGDVQRILRDLDWLKFVKKESFSKFIQSMNLLIANKTVLAYTQEQFPEVAI